MYEDYSGSSDDGYDPYTVELPPVQVNNSDFGGFPDVGTPEDTGGSLADVITDVPVDDRSDINEIIEAGNGYDVDLSFLKNVPSSLWNSIKGLFVDDKGKVNYTALAGIGGPLMALTGLSKPKTGGYKGTIPQLQAVREQIAYNDPNRRPGAGGRRYFTDTQYVDPKNAAAVAAAREAAKAQSQGILAGYTPAAAAAPTTAKFAMPWEKAAAATGAPAASAADALPAIPSRLDIAKETYPDRFISPDEVASPNEFIDPNVAIRPPVEGEMNFVGPTQIPSARTFAAGGQAKMNEPRYLRGITDGMEDRINTSIDDKQPAKLSHGEFVIPADVVSHLGNGNSDAGAKKLYQMMDRVRQARTGTKQQGKQINPDKFMPGGAVGYESGGIVGYQAGGGVDTTTESNLSNWAGDYVTSTLGKAQAAADQPYQAYTGPLTAGASDLQTQAFSGIKDLASTGYTPGTFSSGTFDAGQAAKYMNPYITQALDPQLRELRRQSQISNLGTLAKAGTSGIMGGARRDLMEAENMRNLLGKQSDVLGAGYATAYDKAMGQFNTEQQRQMDAEKAAEASRQFSAGFGRNVLGDMASLGATQRGIEAEGVAADKAEFENQRDYDLKMQQYKMGLLQKMPVETQVSSANMNPIVEALASSGTLMKLLQGMGLIPTEGTATKSAGVTPAPSAGTTGTSPDVNLIG